MKRLALPFIVLGTLCGISVAQALQPVRVDSFNNASNDDLMARVHNFQIELDKIGSNGFVILHGPTLGKYLDQRRIQGCNRWSQRPMDSFKFIFGETQQSRQIEFWVVPRGFKSTTFDETIPDYRLPGLDEPFELSTSTSTDEYCPRYFDLEWYSLFMKANPSFRGKAVIDTSQRDFRSRVAAHRKTLVKLGVDPSRIRFFRKRFIHERDEQWWLIPVKAK